MWQNGVYLLNGKFQGGGGGSTTTSEIPFSIKSANIGTKGEVDLFNISKLVNSGCSFTGTVATGGTNKYLRLLETAPISTADSWEINVPKYTYQGGGSGGARIICPVANYGLTAPILLTDNDVVKIYASSNGLDENIFSNVSTGLTLSIGTSYWLKLSYNSTTGYKLDYSTDGINYTNAWSSATTTKSFCSQPFMFMNTIGDLTIYYASGTMDFSTGSIVIDGDTWYDFSEINNSLTFKVDDGTTYAPLKVVNPAGKEVTLTSITALDLSSFTDGVINIFATATGVEARQNNIFMQTSEPVAENDGDVWINGNVVKDWDNSGSAWVTSTVIAFLGSVIKNGVIENGYCSPLNYNGQSEMSCLNYVSGNLEIDITAKSGFKFYGRYKNYLAGKNTTYKYPTLFFAFYDTSYSGIYAGGTTNFDYSSYVASVSRDIFGYFSGSSKTGYVSVQGYITI